MSQIKEKPLASGMPHCLKKRRLLNDEGLSPELCRDYGEKFLALGWWEDALEFFQKGNCQEGLAKIRDLALENGDVFLLARLAQDEDPDCWRRVADRALESGKIQFARRAFELAGDVDKAADLSAAPGDAPTVH